jgi:predicted acyltransferase (DUF342 family)
VPLRSDPLDELSIPDGTTVEEHDLVTDGDVIVGGQSTVGFGVRGHHVIGGERVRFGGDIEAEGDCRLDMWSDVDGNVLVGRDAYLGERVHVDGQLMVSGDLDIGDDVDIEDGFEANGWIVIRNPMPTIVFLFVYLSQLLRIGEEEAAENVMSDLLGDDEEREHDPLLVPRNATVDDDAWRVSTPATIGDDCRLHGNVRAAELTVGADNNVFGSLRAREDIDIGPGTEIHGDVTTRNGTVGVGPDVHVWGDISADNVVLHEDAIVEGSIRARGEMTLVRDDEETTDATGSTDDQSDDDATDREDGADEASEDDELDGDESEDEAEESATTEQSDDETTAAPTDDATADDATEDDATAVEGKPEAAPSVRDTVAEGTERVTADGTETDDYLENGHEDGTEPDSTSPRS